MLSKSLNNIGNVYFNKGFFEHALAHYSRYLELQKTAHNFITVRLNEKTTGSNYLRMHDATGCVVATYEKYPKAPG